MTTEMSEARERSEKGQLKAAVRQLACCHSWLKSPRRQGTPNAITVDRGCGDHRKQEILCFAMSERGER